MSTPVYSFLLPLSSEESVIHDSMGNHIISVCTDTLGSDNEAFFTREIVKRVNAHDSLVEALRLALQYIDADPDTEDADLDNIRTALSKAVGEAQ